MLRKNAIRRLVQSLMTRLSLVVQVEAAITLVLLVTSKVATTSLDALKVHARLFRPAVHARAVTVLESPTPSSNPHVVPMGDVTLCAILAIQSPRSTESFSVYRPAVSDVERLIAKVRLICLTRASTMPFSIAKTRPHATTLALLVSRHATAVKDVSLPVPQPLPSQPVVVF